MQYRSHRLEKIQDSSIRDEFKARKLAANENHNHPSIVYDAHNDTLRLLRTALFVHCIRNPCGTNSLCGVLTYCHSMYFLATQTACISGTERTTRVVGIACGYLSQACPPLYKQNKRYCAAQFIGCAAFEADREKPSGLFRNRFVERQSNLDFEFVRLIMWH